MKAQIVQYRHITKLEIVQFFVFLSIGPEVVTKSQERQVIRDNIKEGRRPACKHEKNFSWEDEH